MEVLFGKNSILEAVEYGIPIKQVLISEGLKNRESILEKIAAASPGITITKASRKQIEGLSRGGRTGGICAILNELKYAASLESLIKLSYKKTETPLLLVLDEIQDPRNFGAIIRTALAAGFHGIVFPKHRQVGVTGIVATTSAGACFKIPLCEVTNLARSIEKLKENGFWIYGTAVEDSVPVYSIKFNTPLALVIGSEGKGIRRLTRQKCDDIVSIPISPEINSLNASVAAGIFIFEIKRQLT
ncbi:23S rRNA (guanosine(2251)-2'-O)-methyltransferase RlmB [candidate division KSB1 bacterium]